MASTSKSTASTSGNQQMTRTTGNRTNPMHGFMYQTKLLMLFVHRGIRAGHTFRLAADAEFAKKFNDVVYEYTKGERKIYRLLQAKHRINNRDERIRTENLLTESDGDYSLVKYFFSYREIKEEKQFKGAKIQDVIVFTNIDFDHEDLAQYNIKLEIIEKKDIILGMSGDHNLSRTPSLYRFGPDTLSNSMKNVENYELTKLARQLVKCLLRCEVIKHHVEPFKSCHIILAKEVINTRTSNFQNNFLAECSPEDENCSLEETTLRFRTIFKQVFEEETDDKIKFEDLNPEINKGREFKSKKIGLKFSKNFGSKTVKKNKKDSSENALPEEEGWPKNAISSEIKDFFDHLIFAVNQPNEDELGNIIRRELGDGFDEDWTENVYSKFIDKMLKFIVGKEGNWLHSSEWKKFFDAEKEKRQAIFFDIDDPVGLFTGREEQLNNLHKMLLNSESTAITHEVSISGLGGVGKSELVRKYISLHKSDFGNRVIWLDAVSHEELSKSFKELASEKLKISLINSHDQSAKNIKSIVEDVYTYFSAAKSLFIFDNTDENLGLNDITEFLPGSFLPHKPYVVITSRNREWGPIPVLYLDVLTNSEAMELINKALNINSNAQDNEICMLAETLQFFPLALQQALAYINVRDAELKKIGKKFGIGDYLNRFEKDPKQLIDFRLSNEGAYTNTTFTTWNTTIENISSYSKIGEIAVDILNIMAFLGPDDIPASMFLPLCDNEETIGSAVQLLKKFSIVSSGQDPRLLNIHSLVQLVTRLRLSGQDGEESNLVEVCRLSLSYVSQIAKDAQHFLRHKFVAHLEKLLSNLDEWCFGKTRDKTIELNSIVPLLSAMGKEYNAIGSYHKKQELQEFNSENVQAADTFCNLPVNFGGSGEFTKAKELLERALKTKESYYGSDHIEVADTLSSLADTLKRLAELTQTKGMLERALKIKEIHYGFDHIEVAYTLSSLADTLRGLGELVKASELLERALRIEESYCGSEHIGVTGTLCSLADTLRESGEFTKAKELLERALEIKESHYGSEHIQVTDTLCSLADTLGVLGEVNEAKELLERALKIKERHYGSEHIEVAHTLCSLADTLRGLGEELIKARELLERALRIEESCCGSEHIEVTGTLCSLADILRGLGKFTQAIELLEQTLKIKESHYGSEHIQVADTLCSLADNLEVLGEYEKAKEFLERALKIKESHHGSEHIQVADTLCSLADTWEGLGEFTQAKELLQRALGIIEKSSVGSEHIEVVDTIRRLADSRGELGDNTNAKELLKRALLIQESHDGSGSVHIQGREKKKFSFCYEWAKFFDTDREKYPPILFDIRDPVEIFTGREEQLINLHQILHKSESTVVCVTGLGGIGKTELIRKYISLCSSYFGNRIIWLNAESYVELSESFKRLASEKLNISLNDSHDHSPKDIQAVVEEVYTYFSAAKSIFIFDSADDSLGFSGIKEFLPYSSLPYRPHVLIASRYGQWGPIPVLRLDILTNDEAIVLIVKGLKEVPRMKKKSYTQGNDIRRLAEALQNFPLALQQALAFIKLKDAQLKNTDKDLDINVSDYLETFKKMPKELLDFKFPNESYKSYTKTTFNTWNITIEKIRNYPEIGRIAVDILNLMAFLEPDDIPTSMFLPMCDNEELLESAVSLLKQFSLVSSGKDPVLKIHTLVQLVRRLQLSTQDLKESSLAEVCRLSLIFASKIAKDYQYSSRRRFVSHLEKILSYLDELCPEKTEDKATELNSIEPLLFTMGKEYNALEDYHKATFVLKRDLKIREDHFGFEDIKVADTLLLLGGNLMYLGDYAESKKLLERALKIKENHYGSKDIQVADILCSLADNLGRLDDYVRAKELLERALEIRESLYGSEHVQVADTLCSLADNLAGLIEYAKAKELLERALKIKESHYGSEHIQVADTLCSLAENLAGLMEYAKAKELLERALKIKESLYGSEHIQVADTLYSLANNLGGLGEYSKARELLERALKIKESLYGSEHIQVADTLCSLACTMGRLDDYTKVKESLERELKVKESLYGSDHVEVADTLLKLAITFTNLYDYSRAKELLEQALKIKESLYGLEHLEVADMLLNLAVTFISLRDSTKAKESLERALRIQESHNHSKQVKVTDTILNSVYTFKGLGELTKAKELLERALRIKEDHYGPNHIQLSDILCCLTDTFSGLGEFNKARELQDHAWYIKNRLYKFDMQSETRYSLMHINVADALCSLADVLIKLNKYTIANKLLKRALEIRKIDYGPGVNVAYQPHYDRVPDTLCSLVDSLILLGELTKAKKLLERALEMGERNCEFNDDIEVADRLLRLAETLKGLDKSTKAKNLEIRALKLKERFYRRFLE